MPGKPWFPRNFRELLDIVGLLPSATGKVLRWNAGGTAPEFVTLTASDVGADASGAAAAAAAASLPLSGGTMSGAIAMGTSKITGLGNGSSSQDAAAFGQIPTVYSSNPAMDGTAAPGSSANFAHGDHVHPSDTSRSPVAGSSSVVTTGTVTAGTWSSQVTAYNEKSSSYTGQSGTIALSLTNGNVQQFALTGAVTFKMPAVSAANQLLNLTLEISQNGSANAITIQDSSGGSGVVLLGAALSIGASKTGLVVCYSVNGGNWRYGQGLTQS